MKKYAIIGLMAAVSVLIPSIFVFAQDLPPNDFDIAEFTVTPGGVVWTLSTINPNTQQPYFSGKDVTNIVAYYSTDNRDTWTHISGAIRVKILGDTTIRIIFKVDLLPTEDVTDTAVLGDVGDETFLALGPGFWLRRRP